MILNGPEHLQLVAVKPSRFVVNARIISYDGVSAPVPVSQTVEVAGSETDVTKIFHDRPQGTFVEIVSITVSSSTPDVVNVYTSSKGNIINAVASDFVNFIYFWGN